MRWINHIAEFLELLWYGFLGALLYRGLWVITTMIVNHFKQYDLSRL